MHDRGDCVRISSQAPAPPSPTDEEFTAAREWLEKWYDEDEDADDLEDEDEDEDQQEAASATLSWIHLICLRFP